MFAIEHYNTVPDIIVMGKALGVYCPIAATIFSEKVASVFKKHIFGHGQSFSGHALASAGALASIKVIQEDNILAHVQKMGKYLGDKLEEIAKKHPSVGNVRGLGLFWTMELLKNRDTKESVRPQTQKYAPNIVRQISDYMLEEKNIYIPADKFGFWIVPPLVVKKEEIDFIVNAIDDGLKVADDALEN